MSKIENTGEKQQEIMGGHLRSSTLIEEDTEEDRYMS